MDRSRYKWSKILDFHGFKGVFANPSAKIVPRINPIAKKRGSGAAELKYDLTLGVRGGKMWNIAMNRSEFCRTRFFEVLGRRSSKSKTWRSVRIRSSSRDWVPTRVWKAIPLMAFSLSLKVRSRCIRRNSKEIRAGSVFLWNIGKCSISKQNHPKIVFLQFRAPKWSPELIR